MDEPNKTIGSTTAPFSLSTNPDWVTWAKTRIAELEAKAEAYKTTLIEITKHGSTGEDAEDMKEWARDTIREQE